MVFACMSKLNDLYGNQQRRVSSGALLLAMAMLLSFVCCEASAIPVGNASMNSHATLNHNSSTSSSSLNDSNAIPSAPSNATLNNEELPRKRMSPSELFHDARARHRRPVGISELFEWAVVFVLIAPGTFPIMSCIILACAAFWRRRTAALWSASSQASSLYISCPQDEAELSNEYGLDMVNYRRRGHVGPGNGVSVNTEESSRRYPLGSATQVLLSETSSHAE